MAKGDFSSMISRAEWGELQVHRPVALPTRHTIFFTRKAVWHAHDRAASRAISTFI